MKLTRVASRNVPFLPTERPIEQDLIEVTKSAGRMLAECPRSASRMPSRMPNRMPKEESAVAGRVHEREWPKNSFWHLQNE